MTSFMGRQYEAVYVWRSTERTNDAMVSSTFRFEHWLKRHSCGSVSVEAWGTLRSSFARSLKPWIIVWSSFTERWSHYFLKWSYVFCFSQQTMRKFEDKHFQPPVVPFIVLFNAKSPWNILKAYAHERTTQIRFGGPDLRQGRESLFDSVTK